MDCEAHLPSYLYKVCCNRRILTKTLATVMDVLTVTYLEQNGLIVMEAENGSCTNGTMHTWPF
jgi:hypothetical protein